MNYSNEFLLGAYGAYINGSVVMDWKGKPTAFKTTYGIDKLFSTLLPEGNSFSEICKLLLTPLPEIIDKDAIKVARIVGFNRDLLAHGQEIAVYLDEGKKISEFSDQLTHAIDYLRFKGYDCGYGEIPSLIDADIAIDKTKTI